MSFHGWTNSLLIKGLAPPALLKSTRGHVSSKVTIPLVQLAAKPVLLITVCLLLLGCRANGMGVNANVAQQVGAAEANSLSKKGPAPHALSKSRRESDSTVPVPLFQRAAKQPPSAAKKQTKSEREHKQVFSASHQQKSDNRPEPSQPERELPEPEVVSAIPAEEETTPGVLELKEVILSVQEKYPLLRSALLERQVADGNELNVAGAFDLNIKAFGIAAPEGFYKTYRNGIALEQPTFGGGYVFSGYKIGDGNFQPWYGERETNEGGEFAAGFGTPLLKDRAIDKRREAIFKADLARQAVEPAARAQYLEFVRAASYVYWTWVASGQALGTERGLLKLAQARVKQIEERVAAGDLPQITRINNEQLIAARETKVIQAERKLQEAAIKLSLFLRDNAGKPIIPSDSQLPDGFPEFVTPDQAQLSADIARAIAARPELAELNIAAEQVRIEMAQADNMLLPKLDMQLLASKDVGAAASAKGDKTPFELEVGVYGEVPLQRREARGKMVSARGKLAQIEAKREFVINKVTSLVQDSVSALQAAAARIARAETNLQLARETLTLGRDRFNAGDIDLIDLNIYELTVNDAQLMLIDAHADFLVAFADYRAALSVDPLSPTE